MVRDVVVDTCIWVDFFNRPRSRAKAAVDTLIDEDRVVVLGPVLAEVVVTNTIPFREEAGRMDKIVTLSVAPLLGEAIKRIHEETSVSSLFV